MCVQVATFFEQVRNNPQLHEELLRAETEEDVQTIIQETGVETTVEEIQEACTIMACTAAHKLTTVDESWFTNNDIDPDVKAFLREVWRHEQYAKEFVQVNSIERLSQLIDKTDLSVPAEDVIRAMQLYAIENKDRPDNLELSDEDLENVTGGGLSFERVVDLGSRGTGGLIGGGCWFGQGNRQRCGKDLSYG